MDAGNKEMLAGLAVMEKSKKKREKKKPERIGNITNETDQKKSHQRFSVSSGLNYLFCGVTRGTQRLIQTAANLL